MSHYCSDGTHDSPAQGCYWHHDCRCDGCTAAASAYNAGRNAAIRHEVKLARGVGARLVSIPVLDLPWYQDRKVES